jgi:LmbE family N-acetylglucosaminyl deacetylase
MATLVCFHAHPDDESIATGGTMMKAKADGHRVVLVMATRGEHGEPTDGVLDPGEQLGLRRIGETFASAEVLGVDRVEFLGYVDSGMIDTPTNDFAYAFWQADVEQAAGRLALILQEERADVLTVYDDNGGYGHPDHIQVHRVGLRAAALAGTPKVFEATINRDSIKRAIRANAAMLSAEELAEFGDLDDPKVEFGVTEDRITHAVDVADFTAGKRASMRCHASQISEDDFFLAMPEEAFAMSFGTEWYIEHGATRGEGTPFIDAVI